MIEFVFDSPSVINHLERLEERVLAIATRGAVNKAIRKARRLADADFSRRYGLGAGSDGKPSVGELIEHNKLRLKDVRQGRTGRIWAKLKSENLIHYVVGPKKPQRLKGIPVKARRRLYVNVGRIGSHPKSFIQRPATRPGGIQVFSPLGKGSKKLRKQVLPSALSVMTRKRLAGAMEATAHRLLEKEFVKSFERQLGKISPHL